LLQEQQGDKYGVKKLQGKSTWQVQTSARLGYQSAVQLDTR